MRAERYLAAFAVAFACGSALAAELGTLFTTPAERSRLDRLRRGEPEIPPAAAAAKRPSLVTGFVKRSDDRNTVWIDGKPVPAGKNAPPLDPAKVRDPRDKSAIEIHRSR